MKPALEGAAHLRHLFVGWERAAGSRRSTVPGPGAVVLGFPGMIPGRGYMNPRKLGFDLGKPQTIPRNPRTIPGNPGLKPGNPRMRYPRGYLIPRKPGTILRKPRTNLGKPRMHPRNPGKVLGNPGTKYPGG